MLVQNHHALPDISFNGHCLIKNSISIPPKIINLYICYILGHQFRNVITNFTACSFYSLFGSVKLTKNADLCKYKYTGYCIGFDSHSDFLFTDGSYGENVIIFRAHMSSSVHVDNKGKETLIFSEGPTQELDDTKLTGEAKYHINFTQSGKNLY